MTDETYSHLVVSSLQRRMRAMHSLYYQAVETMDLDQVNHFEREGVLPIAFSLFHYTNMHDASFMLLTGVTPIWDAAWQDKVRMAVDDHGKERTVEEMTSQRIGDYEAFRAYQRLVFDRTEAHLAVIDAADLADLQVLMDTPGDSDLDAIARATWFAHLSGGRDNYDAAWEWSAEMEARATDLILAESDKIIHLAHVLGELRAISGEIAAKVIRETRQGGGSW